MAVCVCVCVAARDPRKALVFVWLNSERRWESYVVRAVNGGRVSRALSIST